MEAYQSFLAHKEQSFEGCGFEVEPDELPALLYPFQRDITRWALSKGRASIFSDCGTGKSFMQLAWADQIRQRENGDVLILAPLAVSAQTVAEGAKLGIEVTACRTASDIRRGINITNYERLEKVADHPWTALILDESSILKGFDGKFRRAVTSFARTIAYRLACTATPAPNDLLELANHAEFLDVLSFKEIVALFFKQDGNTTHAWRLKRHAEQPFYRWLASWAVALRKPSDLGYPDDGFLLPPLTYDDIVVASPPPDGELFAKSTLSLQEMRGAMRASMSERVRVCAERVNATTEPYLVWCHLNDESTALTEAIPGAVEVRGSDQIDDKESKLLDFSRGNIRVMVTKPSIAGHGLNLQRCSRMDFVGLSYSFELLYQAVRRCWRFGQTKPVTVGLIHGENEGAIKHAIERKERQATDMMDRMVKEMSLYAVSENR